MNPDIWGSSFWIILHLLSFEYDIEDKEYHKNFLENLGNILPCVKCQIEYKKYMTKSKIEYILKSKQNYVKGIWEFHNKVNKRLNKKIYSFEEFKEIYKEINKKKKFNCIELLKENIRLKNIILFLLLIIVCLIFVFVYIYFSK